MAAGWVAAWLLAAAVSPAADGLEEGLAILPAELRREVRVVPSRRPCPPGDPLAGVTSAEATVELCAGDLRRQARFAAVRLLDERLGWSREARWLRLNGWEREALRPWRWRARNQAPEAYAAPVGRSSPSLDLAALAAAWLEGDRDLACRLLPQTRFLAEKLRALGTVVVPTIACPDFEAWASRDRLDHIELTLATPSTVTMASMFGHVFLRLVERAPAGAPPSFEDRTIAFLVETAVPVTEERFYALKGIAGAYQATLVERSFLETYRTYVVAEGRDLRRFRLELSPAETDALLERIWSLRQAGQYRYYFFAANCATLMVDLINGVLPVERQVRYPEALATTPAGTLEGYAATRTASGGPLATFIPDTILSLEHQARAAAAERAVIAGRLANVPGFAALWPAIRGGDERARTAAYRTLPTAPAGDVQRFLRASAIVETHLSTLANLEAEERADRQRRARLHDALVAALAHPPGTGPCARAGDATRLVASAELEDRLAGYRALHDALEGPCGDDPAGDGLRRLALLAITARHDTMAVDEALHDALLFPEPERRLGEQRFATGLAALIDHPYVTRVSPALLAVQQAQRALAGTAPLESPDELRLQESAARSRAEDAADAASIPRTGIDELEVGVVGGNEPALLLGGALHDERLGDQRRFGFPSHTALTVMQTQTALVWRRGRPAVGDWRARALGYRSLPPRLEAGGWRPRLGGELALDLAGRSGGRSVSLRFGGGGLVALAASPGLASHLLASAGPLVGFDQGGGAPAIGVAGASFALEGRVAARAPGGWLGARAELRPLLTTAGTARELGLVAELRAPLVDAIALPGADTPRALTLRLAARFDASTVPGMPGTAGRVTAALAFE